jgi:hypothetical protein
MRLIVGMAVYALAFAQAVVMVSEGQRAKGAMVGGLCVVAAIATASSINWQAQNPSLASARTKRDGPQTRSSGPG